MKLNPYIAGNPVGGSEAFIGRKGVYQEVLRVLKSPNENGIVLYGQRRIGKTSVLQELEKNLPDNGPFFSVYFDLQDKAALSLNEVLKQLAEKISYDLEIPALDKLDNDFENEFKKVFLPYLLSQLPENSAFVLLFDEFDVLTNSSKKKAGSTLFPYLRDLMAEDIKRINFIFVVGRRIEDLSSEFLSLFKGVKSRRVSLLSFEDTEILIRLSEQNDSLKWENNSVLKVQALAGGHTFLTQQLCQSIWENMYDDDPEDVPVVKSDDVEKVVPETLKSATNSLEWLWAGLGPAERVVASAIAEAGAKVITQEELEQLLQESGVRILIGELQDAPRVLEEWDIIQPENEGFRFRVEMLRRWIAQKKPLARVQDEIDRIKPLAENLFQAAYGFYQVGQLKEAIPLLQQSANLNPNHLKANQLLAEIFIAEGKIDDALNILETLYEYHPFAARPRLVQALLMKAKAENNENMKLELYKRILNIDKNQKEAIAEYKRILVEIKAENFFQDAFGFYQVGQLKEAIPLLQQSVNLNPNHLKANQLLAEIFIAEGKIDAALNILESLFQYHPLAARPRLVQALLMKAKSEQDEGKKMELYKRVLNIDENQKEALAEYDRISTKIKKAKESIHASLKNDFINSFNKTFVLIKPGSFMMGSLKNEPERFDNEIHHKVTITKSFYMQSTPVTQGQWKTVMGNNPSHFKNCGDNCPVENVSWNNAQEFIKKLNQIEKISGYRLPTEAEWEYACRAGTTTPFNTGRCLGIDQANYNGNHTQKGCPKGISRNKTVPVKNFPANLWGLYDMHGNVREWCQDWYGIYSKNPEIDPVGPTKGSFRVRRGGSWKDFAQHCRSADRGYGHPTGRDKIVGFRLVCSPKFA